MPYKLLLADDSVTIQRVIELTFADEDIQVTPVSDGEAIVSIDAEPPTSWSDRMPDGGPSLAASRTFGCYARLRAGWADRPARRQLATRAQIVIARVRERRSQALVRRASPILGLRRTADPQAAERGEPRTWKCSSVRLSAAFAELSSKQRSRQAEDMPSAHADPLDRFERAVETQAPDLALSYKSPPIAGSATAQTPSAPTLPVTPPAAFVPAQSPAFQAQGDADAALTTAKHVARAGTGWPAEPAPSAIAIEDLVEQVTRRTMERLSDQVVREAVSDLVRDRTAEVVRQMVPDLVRESTSEVVRQMVPNLVSDCTSELVRQVGPHLVGDRISDLVREMAPNLLRERVSEIVRDLAPELVRQAVADAVRATARELFIPIAERMVREEINRINASIG